MAEIKVNAEAEAPVATAAAAAAAEGECEKQVINAVAVKFLRRMIDDDDDSDSDSGSEAEVPVPCAKPPAAVKSVRAADKKPSPPTLRRTRSGIKKEAEEVALAVAMSMGKQQAPSPKEKRASKGRRRSSSSKSEEADTKPAKPKAPVEKKQKKETRRRRAQPSGSVEEGDTEAKSKRAEATEPPSAGRQRQKLGDPLAAAGGTDEGVDAKRMRKRKVDEQGASSTETGKAAAKVTPSPARKRSRVAVASASVATLAVKAPRELTEEEKAAKEVRRRRMIRMRNQREERREQIELEAARRQGQEARDRAAKGDNSAEGESATGDPERRSVKETKRTRREGGKSVQRIEKEGSRKVSPHKKRRLQDAIPVKIETEEEAARDAQRVSPEEKGDGERTGDNEGAATSQDDSTAADDDKASVGDAAARKRNAPVDDPADAGRKGVSEIKNEAAVPEQSGKPVSLAGASHDEAEDGQVHEDGEVKEPTASDVKSEPDLAHLPIPKKSTSQLDASADAPIPRKSARSSEDPAVSFVIPKRSMKKLEGVGGSDAAQATAANGAEAVVLSSSRMVRKARVTIPNILKAVVQSAPAALKRPARRRTKQQVPSEVTSISAEEREFVRLARRRRSLVAGCLSADEFARGPTPYEAFDAEGGLLPDLVPRLTCPSLLHLTTNGDEFPSSYFGVGLTSPKVHVKAIEAEDAKTDATTDPKTDATTDAKTDTLNCFEPLVFARPEDRDAYQRKMYGTTFVPQMLKGHATLIMRNARYERKSRGIRFNADRDREDYAQVLSQRFKMNKSVPVCEIPRDSWRKMMVKQSTGLVYIHYYNREDAMLAALAFVDDLGVPLEWKREYRAGVVLNANVSPAVAPRRSRSNDRISTPGMSPEGSLNGSDRDRDRDFRDGRRRDRWRGPPPARERSRYGDPSVMQRSPSGIDYRTSFTTPTNTSNEWKRDGGAERPMRKSRSRSRSRQRSRSRSHSVHTAAPRDEERKRLSIESGDGSNQAAGGTGDESRGESAVSGSGDSADPSKASQDGGKSAESDKGAACLVDQEPPTSGNAKSSRDADPASEDKPGTEPGELSNDEEQRESKEKPTAQNDDKRRDAYANKHHQPDHNNGWRPNMDADRHRGASNGDSRQGPPQWRSDGRSRRGGRSRSRERPRHLEPRRDWERGPPPPMHRDYEPRRDGNYMGHRGRGRDDAGCRDNRQEFLPLLPPPPPPPRDVRHYDRRRY